MVVFGLGLAVIEYKKGAVGRSRGYDEPSEEGKAKVAETGREGPGAS
jgi:hypothetical protein